MEEILLKDKVVYITPHTYEIKRLNGKWFKSFFQIDVINHVYIIDFMLAWMIVLFSLLQIKTASLHLSSLFGGFLFSLVLSFLRYYQPVSIPVGGVRKTYVNNNNQLVIDYIRKKRKLSKAVNLPAEASFMSLPMDRCLVSVRSVSSFVFLSAYSVFIICIKG